MKYDHNRDGTTWFNNSRPGQPEGIRTSPRTPQENISNKVLQLYLKQISGMPKDKRFCSVRENYCTSQTSLTAQHDRCACTNIVRAIILQSRIIFFLNQQTVQSITKPVPQSPLFALHLLVSAHALHGPQSNQGKAARSILLTITHKNDSVHK